MVKTFALVLGILYTAVGILGFFPAMLTPPEPARGLALDAMHGRLLGLFPVNVLHNVVHLTLGVWGLVAARSFIRSVVFARGLTIVYGLLAVMGLIPGFDTLFGLVPLYGADIWLHAGTAAVSAYFGWGAPARVRFTVGST